MPTADSHTDRSRGQRRWTAALILCCALIAAPVRSEDAPLRVMLQGDDSARLAQLVQEAGGEVTHRLHIIEAVGAIMSRAQLDSVLASGDVRRHIDDLSLAPPEDEPEPCDVGGALELKQQGQALIWRLYNKGSETAALEELRLKWPEQFGGITEISFNGVPLRANSVTRPEDGELVVEVPPLPSNLLPRSGELRLGFAALRDGTSWQQRDLSLRAEFVGGCFTELIPGYASYGQDTYYPAVIGADQLHRRGITGAGVAVAILDSGLWEHPSLALDTQHRDRVIGRYDAIKDRTGSEVFDESGHGTHMTSVLAHSGRVIKEGRHDGSYMGIAPDARIVAVKAFNKAGQGDFLDIVRGIQWVVDNREKLGIRVLNLSFSARPRWPYWLDPINQAVMRAWQAGITVVAAAGNEGPDQMTIGSPGNLPYLITVGAITDSWTPENRIDDYIPDFSSRGPTPSAHIKPDLVAPGGHIAGITRPGSTLTEEHPDYVLSSGEFVMTGTSQAAALVSGIAALLLQLEPDLSPDDVKCKLISSADLAINRNGKLAYSPFQQGNGYVSATRAVTLGERGCGNPGLYLERDLANEEHYEGPAILADDGSTSLPGLETLYDSSPSEKGASDNRRWGVKAHIERDEHEQSGQASAVDWRAQYLQEKERIERLSATRPQP